MKNHFFIQSIIAFSLGFFTCILIQNDSVKEVISDTLRSSGDMIDPRWSKRYVKLLPSLMGLRCRVWWSNPRSYHRGQLLRLRSGHFIRWHNCATFLLAQLFHFIRWHKCSTLSGGTTVPLFLVSHPKNRFYFHPSTGMALLRVL